ncbi:hypothetical protein Vafri_13671 [Volvox africanus]|uniref:Tbc2 translation factor, chloroplastic n=1 Tax=Volvox africanus TaxID=51714 RepID=A0A8J4BCK0_9CHLO|nr:hypothetical protein Vafri_13671 [Volvox africanus]
MDVASTSGRICLSLTEVIYSQRISSFFSRSDLCKATKPINYNQGATTRAPASRCRGRGWRHHRHSNRWTLQTQPATVYAGFRQDSAQHHHQCPVLTTPTDIATNLGTTRSSGHRRGLSASAAATLDSYSPTSGAIAGRSLSANGFPVHPNAAAAAAAIDGTVALHRLQHTLAITAAVDALDDEAGVEGRAGFQRFRSPLPMTAAAAPPPPVRLRPPQAPRLNPVAQAALNRQITDCTDWLALEALYRSVRSPAAVIGGSGASTAAPAASSPLGGVQLVAMARHLARLPRHCSFAKFEDERLQLFASELAAATIPYLGDMAQGEYCALLWAYGKIGCHPGEDFLSALLPRLQPLLPAAGPTGLSQALWGLARMGHVPPEPFLFDFYGAADRALRMPSANPQHISNLLWAMVMLRLQAPQELISQALAVLDGKLQAATPQALAITAWAVVQVGERAPPEVWWHRIQQAALQLKGKLQPQDISHLVWATARSGHPGPQSWLQAMCSEAHGCMRGFRSQELCNLLWGFVVVGFKPPEPWLTAAISAAQNLLPNFKGFELAVLLWCLASLQAKPLLPRTFARALFFHSGSKLRYFSAQDCANVIWSLARLQLRPPEPWMAAFVEESFTQLPRFTPQHLANTIWGFARLSRCPPEPWMDRFFLESRPLLLSFKTGELAMLAMALGIARLDPPRQWLNQMLVASYPKLEHCRAQELANLVWGFWRVFFKPPQRWLDAVATAASRLTDQGAMTNTDLITLGRAFSAFGAELPANVRQALTAAEEAQLLLQMPQQIVEVQQQQLVSEVRQQTGREQPAGLQQPGLQQPGLQQGHQQQQTLEARGHRKPRKPNHQQHPDVGFQQQQPQQEWQQPGRQLRSPTRDGLQHSGKGAASQPGVRSVASSTVQGQPTAASAAGQSGIESAARRTEEAEAAKQAAVGRTPAMTVTEVAEVASPPHQVPASQSQDGLKSTTTSNIHLEAAIVAEAAERRREKRRRDRRVKRRLSERNDSLPAVITGAADVTVGGNDAANAGVPIVPTVSSVNRDEVDTDSSKSVSPCVLLLSLPSPTSPSQMPAARPSANSLVSDMASSASAVDSPLPSLGATAETAGTKPEAGDGAL